MFQFENREYERILESSLRRGKFTKDCKKLLSDLQECLEGLTLHEVNFLLALRKCDSDFRLELCESLILWYSNRMDFFEKFARIMENKDFMDATKRLARE